MSDGFARHHPKAHAAVVLLDSDVPEGPLFPRYTGGFGSFAAGGSLKLNGRRLCIEGIDRYLLKTSVVAEHCRSATSSCYLCNEEKNRA